MRRLVAQGRAPGVRRGRASRSPSAGRPCCTRPRAARARRRGAAGRPSPPSSGRAGRAGPRARARGQASSARSTASSGSSSRSCRDSRGTIDSAQPADEQHVLGRAVVDVRQHRMQRVAVAADVLPAPGAHRPLRVVGGVVRHLGEELVAHLPRLAADQRQQRAPLDVRRRLDPGELADRRVDVEVLHQRVDRLAAAEPARAAQDEHDAGAAIGQGRLRPGNGQAVVGRADDERVAVEPGAREGVQDDADAAVELAPRWQRTPPCPHGSRACRGCPAAGRTSWRPAARRGRRSRGASRRSRRRGRRAAAGRRAGARRRRARRRPRGAACRRCAAGRSRCPTGGSAMCCSPTRTV